ncbi:uncharacterized protein LOC121798732 [Salvia splendens]|nr:uncharacterized protein LOC121798732 [Salvia splendens]XP_042053818.1 uncharacterized protein LOC121798732 [Salvia splendens]XP_042053827.1 uncharacterized protein LOC121798732 [Salvia splendens]
MLELLAQGWKSDNDFRNGYFEEIEDSLRKEFPNTDLKGTPHITSRISAWKKNYTSLTKILGRSGVGFNSDGQYMIECDDDQWDAIVQADKDAKFMRGKSWPLWDTWKAIFGKDRASSAGAEQVNDAVNRMRRNGPSLSEVNENEFPDIEERDSENVVRLSQASGFEAYSSGNNGKQASINKSGGSQKRKHDGADAAIMEFLSNLHAETNARLEVISSRIAYEFDLGKSKQDVFDKLETVEGLTLDERYELCNILSDKLQRLEVFMGMRAGARLGYLLKLIEENQKVM